MSISITFTFSTPAELKEFVARAVPNVYTEADAKAHTEGAKPDPKPQAEKTATKPAADTKPAAGTKPSADTAKSAAPAVTYDQLAGAVLKLMKADPAAAGPIAKGLGFDTFKLMKEAPNAAEVIAQAFTAVNAKLAELESAGV